MPPGLVLGDEAFRQDLLGQRTGATIRCFEFQGKANVSVILSLGCLQPSDFSKREEGPGRTDLRT